MKYAVLALAAALLATPSAAQEQDLNDLRTRLFDLAVQFDGNATQSTVEQIMGVTFAAPEDGSYHLQGHKSLDYDHYFSPSSGGKTATYSGIFYTVPFAEAPDTCLSVRQFRDFLKPKGWSEGRTRYRSAEDNKTIDDTIDYDTTDFSFIGTGKSVRLTTKGDGGDKANAPSGATPSNDCVHEIRVS